VRIRRAEFHARIAVAAKRDRIDFLLEQLGAPLARERQYRFVEYGSRSAVIKTAAGDRVGGKPMPAGREQVAFYCSHAAILEVADVSVSPDKVIKVNRVTVVGDVGTIVNRSMAENQCQISRRQAQHDGGLAVTFENGRAMQHNFDQYPILRIHTPQVDVYFVDSDYTDRLGEPALPPLAPAVCNAIFAAVDTVRTLPIAEEGGVKQ
jgi:isoquinoline 1-oxidoreductase beta subunit